MTVLCEILKVNNDKQGFTGAIPEGEEARGSLGQTTLPQGDKLSPKQPSNKGPSAANLVKQDLKSGQDCSGSNNEMNWFQNTLNWLQTT